MRGVPQVNILQIRRHKLKRLKLEELKLKVLGDSNGGWYRVRWQVWLFSFVGDFSYNLLQENVISKKHYLFPFDSMTLSGKWIHNKLHQYIITAFLLTEQGCQINTESLEKAPNKEEGNNF